MSSNYNYKQAVECCKVPIPALFVNPLDENQKKELLKGPVPHWRWERNPKGQIEYQNRRFFNTDYDFYSKRFSDSQCLSQENNFGRSENTEFLLNGFGPKDI